MAKETHTTFSEEDTIALGNNFAERLIPGDIVALFADLGMGKTQFIKGICNFFDVHEIVTSPTFTIINQYFGRKKDKEIPIYHVDLYRIKSANDLGEIGLNEYIYSKDSIILIEWAEIAERFLPETKYSIHITGNIQNEDERVFDISW